MPPLREREDSWARRRAEYRRWLAEPGSFCLVAEEDGALAGYALVRVGAGDDTWRTGDRQAELETLAVAPEARGRGVGTALMDAVHEGLAELGIVDLFVGVVVGNHDALRFYARHGLTPSYVHLYRRRG
jgi:ribosomal protein S18 acetylase RimI-like enzyme